MEIPAGWSQIPLQADTPYQLETGLAQVQQQQSAADLAKTNSQLAATEAPMKSQLMANEVSNSNAAVPTTQLGNLAAQQTLGDNLMAQAAARAKASDDPQTSWATDMQALADQGVPRASQLAHQGYSDKLAATVSAWGAGPTTGKGASASASQLGADGGDGGSLTSYGAQDQAIDRIVAGAPPAQVPQILAQKMNTLDTIRQAIVQIRNAPDPIAAWDQHASVIAQDLGLPNPAGKFAGDHAGLEAELNKLDSEIVPFETAIQTRMARGQLGVGQPPAPMQVEKVDDALYGIQLDPKTGGFTAKPLTPVGKSILVNTTTGADGKTYGVYFNGKTGQDSVGNVPLDVQGRSGRETATMQKYKLLIGAGMDAVQAGMIVSGDKQMSQQEITTTAQSLATKEISGQQGGMDSPTFVKDVQSRADEIAAQLTAANGMKIPAPGAPSGSGGAPAPGGAPGANYGPTPGQGIDAGAKLKALSAAPAQYQAARAQLIKTGNWQAFDAVFGQGAAGQMMAKKNSTAYTGP